MDKGKALAYVLATAPQYKYEPLQLLHPKTTHHAAAVNSKASQVRRLPSQSNLRVRAVFRALGVNKHGSGNTHMFPGGRRARARAHVWRVDGKEKARTHVSRKVQI
jgi:hypothetical protein